MLMFVLQCLVGVVESSYHQSQERTRLAKLAKTKTILRRAVLNIEFLWIKHSYCLFYALYESSISCGARMKIRAKDASLAAMYCRELKFS
jgi:hypothetical protein